ncbi:MAG TPA: NAD(+)/NADH kinase [Candidatus Bipolaricaulis anaerobius]|nr:NAD(+)/NADH kinase [Candidatus Bipolaricaulis anaerobius]HNS23920.1 NAD(+)/NADH kinase [Candidatus Bipolaricaulis anaerobius]
MALRRVLFVPNLARPAAVAATERGLAWCRREGIAVATVPGKGAPSEADLVVAVGGDGTLLRAAALVYPHPTPVLAAHAGGLGFLAACDGEEIEGALDLVATGQYRVERRARLLAAGPGFVRSALNDAVAVGPDAERFTALEVAVDGEPALAVEGDGLIISTPTGSTAYALAAGGPVLAPSVAGLLLVPLAPHRLGVRPCLVPPQAQISIRLWRRGRLLLDGNSVCELEPEAMVNVTTAPAETLLVRLAGTGSFFTRLRGKLNLSD